LVDYIIVGGGIGGLQIAALLVDKGFSVKVFEKSSHVGGRAFVWEKDGYLVDNGLHLIRFGKKSAIAGVFSKLGKKIDFLPVGKSFLYDVNGKISVFPTSPLSFMTTNLLTVTEKLSAIKYLLKIKGIKDKWKDYLDISVKSWLDDNGIEGNLRKYFELVAGSMQVCPFVDKTSVGEMFDNVSKVLNTGISVMYPKGGWKPLFDFLIEKINKNGEIVLNAKVEKIIIKDGKATGIIVDSKEYSAENIIINIPVQEMFEVTGEDVAPKEYYQKMKNLVPTSGVVIDLGLKKEVSKLNGLVYFYKPMAFGMFTSNIDKSVAPKGKQLLTFFYPTSYEDMVNNDQRELRKKEIMDKIFEIWSDLKENIEWERIATLKMVDGAQVNVNQTRDLRSGYKFPGVDSLYLVGDSLGAAGSGGDIVHESVHGVYREITGEDI